MGCKALPAPNPRAAAIRTAKRTGKLHAYFKEQREREDRELHQVLAGERSPAYGARRCDCKARWNCATCGKPFACWTTYNFAWLLMPPHVRSTKVCRGCYGEWLLIVLADRAELGLPLRTGR